MNSNYKYKNGDRVHYKINDLIKGIGIIRGVASIGSAVIGVSYILEDSESVFPNSTYPYSHFVVFECMLRDFACDTF